MDASGTSQWGSGYRPKKMSRSTSPWRSPVCPSRSIAIRCLNRDIVVQGNPRVYKALRNQLAAVLDELKRIENASELRDELLDNIELITRTLYGMKEGSE